MCYSWNFSEEKAKLLRRIGGNIDEKDQELALFLTSLQVSANLLNVKSIQSII